MIELVKYFRILFLSAKISRDRLKDFTEDHIQRLIANNPGGIFTASLTAITTAYNSYFGDLASEELNLAVQKGKTTAMKESRAALLKMLSDNEGLIAYKYKDNKAKYELFYPQGMDEYNHASISHLGTISGRYKSALSNNSGDFDPQFITDYNTVQQTFIDNRAAQEGAKGNVSAERSDLQVSRPELCTQLTKNLLTIALQYVGDESKSDVYFNQAILNAAFKESETRVESELGPGHNEVVFSNITKATVGLMVKNNGSVPLVFGFVANETDPLVNDPDSAIEPGVEKGTSAGEAGWTAEKKILKVASFAGEVGSYIARKV
jgi:hypothetical protein